MNQGDDLILIGGGKGRPAATRHAPVSGMSYLVVAANGPVGRAGRNGDNILTAVTSRGLTADAWHVAPGAL
jgi:hypothetical protein